MNHLYGCLTPDVTQSKNIAMLVPERIVIRDITVSKEDYFPIRGAIYKK